MTADHNKLAKDNLLLLSTTLEGLASEGNNIRSERLDEMSALEIAQLMNSEDQTVATAVQAVLAPVAQAIDAAHQALQAGGRIIYVGAGTSGRLGVLDASEIPPTFSAPPDLFHALIAGGQPAIFQAQEGIEDDRMQGALDLHVAQVGEHDVVIGLAVSGRTPMFWPLWKKRKSAAPPLLVFHAIAAARWKNRWILALRQKLAPKFFRDPPALNLAPPKRWC